MQGSKSWHSGSFAKYSDLGLVTISFPACCVSHRATGLPVIPGLFVPLHFRSWERKDHRENFRSCGTFVPWNIRSLERSLELSFLGSEGSKNFRSVEHSLPWNFRSSGENVPRTFVPVQLSYHENEYFTNFRSKCHKTRPINFTIAYMHQSPAVNNFQQRICRQCSTGAKALSTGNYRSTIASRVITSRVHRFVNFSAVSVALT